MTKLLAIVTDVGVVYVVLLLIGSSSTDCTYNCETSLSEVFQILALIAVPELVALFITWILFRMLDGTITRFKSYDGYSDTALL